MVTVTQSDDNQARQNDESSQMEHTNNGLYIIKYVEFLICMVHWSGGHM